MSSAAKKISGWSSALATGALMFPGLALAEAKSHDVKGAIAMATQIEVVEDAHGDKIALKPFSIQNYLGRDSREDPDRGGFIEAQLGASRISRDLPNQEERLALGLDVNIADYNPSVNGAAIGVYGGFFFHRSLGLRLGARRFGGDLNTIDAGIVLDYGGLSSFYIKLGPSHLEGIGAGFHYEMGYGFRFANRLRLQAGWAYCQDFGNAIVASSTGITIGYQF